MASERREGPTPAGGDYSEATYLVSLTDHTEADAGTAGAVVIREMVRGEDGAPDMLVNEVWATITR